jgi:hypothetical protein
MILSNRLRPARALALLLVCACASLAQMDKKPYTEWSEKEADKVLNNSGWGQTQTFTDTSLQKSSIADDPKTASRTQADSNNSASLDYGNSDLGATRVSDVPIVNFRMRLLTARPVREAIVRMLAIRRKEEPGSQMAEQFKKFIDSETSDQIIIAVVCDAPKVTVSFQKARTLLLNLTTAELKNNTFLFIKGNERVPLAEYQPPRPDGLGARFIFPRTINGKPVITAESGEARFYSELSDKFTLNRKFRVKDMMYQGKLEY